MNLRTIAIMIFVTLLAIGGYIFFVQKTQPKRNTQTNEQAFAQLETLQNQFKNDFPQQLKQDELPLFGTYRWQFFLGPVKQVSTHNFLSSAIDYQMTGKVYSTDYRMHQLSYDATQKKWIGTADGVVYVLFFKDISDNTLTLYKRKCKNGLAEAVAFSRPADDATTDHGWNIYTLDGVTAEKDTLPVSGMYQSINNEQISLSDASVTWQGKTYQKLTHHQGEKLWVGQLDDTYLLLFYQLPTSADTALSLSLQIFDNIEKAYQAKHDEQKFTNYQTTTEGK